MTLGDYSGIIKWMVVNQVIVCLLEKVAAGDFGTQLIFCALLRADSDPVYIETRLPILDSNS